MKKVIMIDGGAGRVICAIPSMEKYVRNNPKEDVTFLIGGWDNIVWGNDLLQDITYSFDTKGVFKNLIRDADEIISPEPYRLPSYFRQEKSLAEAFDEIINRTNDHTDLSNPKIILNKNEEKSAARLLGDIKSQQQKQKTIIIQPFGRSAQRVDDVDIIDESSRSIEPRVYLELVKKLSTKYNLVFFGEKDIQVPGDDYTSKPELPDLRAWASVVEAADYFVGCDSVGQHMARAFDKPGTVIIGSTFPVNTSYPNYFNIIEKSDIEKAYSPIRISGLDSHLADRINDRCMEFSDEEINDIYKSIVSDIEAKVK